VKRRLRVCRPGRHLLIGILLLGAVGWVSWRKPTALLATALASLSACQLAGANLIAAFAPSLAAGELHRKPTPGFMAMSFGGPRAAVVLQECDSGAGQPRVLAPVIMLTPLLSLALGAFMAAAGAAQLFPIGSGTYALRPGRSSCIEIATALVGLGSSMGPEPAPATCKPDKPAGGGMVLPERAIGVWRG
jgi:hypothetical protein